MVGNLNIFKLNQINCIMVELDKLYKLAIEASTNISITKRYDYQKILNLVLIKKVKSPFVLISGLRGVGKTTLLLQLFKEIPESFYFLADHILIKRNSLFEIAQEASKNGYNYILIDEIHKYPNWINELKNIYDTLNVQVIASGSSTASIKKGAIFLGRRAINMSLQNLTFGEFVYFKTGQIKETNIEIALDSKASIRWVAENGVEKFYKEYLHHGGFPYSISNIIFSLIKKMIYEDALSEFSLSEKKVDIAEKLISFLASSPPGEFSYTSFSSISGYAKSTVYETVKMLEELELIRIIDEGNATSKAKSLIKIMFSHPNLRSAVSYEMQNEPNIGALREDYFLFHMSNLGYSIKIPKHMRKNPDYLIKMDLKNRLFEIGGSSKSNLQFLGQEGVIMKDENLMALGFVQKIDQK